jgi:hypothetical protein
MSGGQLALAMDPPTVEPRQRKDSSMSAISRSKASALDRVAGRPGRIPAGIAFSALRAELTWQNGDVTIREGVVKGPTIGATIEGSIDYPGNQVRMRGTFIPMYGLNNIPAQIPLFGLFLGGGSNEGVIGVTYEVVGSPDKPSINVNPISAVMPGLLRKIFEFGPGKQNNPADFQSPSNSPNNN